MEPKEKTKAFDAVKMMRDIRDKITEETQGMTLEQSKKYIADRCASKHSKIPSKPPLKKSFRIA